jgi:YVTN family beta-propeller protein
MRNNDVPHGAARPIRLVSAFLAALLIAASTAAAAEITATIPLPRGAGELTNAFGSIWSANSVSDSISRVDPSTNRVIATIRTGGQPGYMTAAAGALWVTQTETANGRDGHTVLRLDPLTNRITARVRVQALPEGVTLAGDRLWVGNHHAGTLSVINPITGRVARTVPVVSVPVHHTSSLVIRSTVQSLAASATALWAGVPAFSGVVRLNPLTGRVAATIPIPSANAACGGLAASATSVFVSSGGCGASVVRIDAHTDRVTHTTRLPVPPGGGVSDPVVTLDGGAWAVAGHTLVRLNSSGVSVSQTPLPLDIRAPYGLAFSAEALWLTSFDNSNLYRVQP